MKTAVIVIASLADGTKLELVKVSAKLIDIPVNEFVTKVSEQLLHSSTEIFNECKSKTNHDMVHSLDDMYKQAIADKNPSKSSLIAMCITLVRQITTVDKVTAICNDVNYPVPLKLLPIFDSNTAQKPKLHS